MTSDAPVSKHKHKFDNDSDNRSTAHQLYTVHTEYTADCCCWCVKMANQLLPQRPSNHKTMHKKCYLLDAQESAKPEQHWLSNAGIKCFICSKLKMNAHLVGICPEDMRGRYVLCFIITSKISLVVHHDDLGSHSGVPRKDTSIMWSSIVVQQVISSLHLLISLNFELCENHQKYNFFSYQFTSMVCNSLLAAHTSTLYCTSGYDVSPDSCIHG